jgi:uncharacterized protein YdeI (YjbR/CyaY-like superfamily)
VDEALCFGWIDGLRKNIDTTSYCIRFTPRRPRNSWSNVNVKRACELEHAGLMRPAGSWWVISVKRDVTRLRRLKQLIG